MRQPEVPASTPRLTKPSHYGPEQKPPLSGYLNAETTSGGYPSIRKMWKNKTYQARKHQANPRGLRREDMKTLVATAAILSVISLPAMGAERHHRTVAPPEYRMGPAARSYATPPFA